MGTIKTTNIETITGSGTLTIGQSGETISIPSGATLDLSNATQTGVGGTMTPAFEATINSDKTMTAGEVVTKAPFDIEVFDTDNAYDNSTNYRFTIPTGKGGKYFISNIIRFETGGVSRLNYFWCMIRKNGSNEICNHTNFQNSLIRSFTGEVSGIIELSAGDYVEPFYAISVSTGTPVIGAESLGKNSRFFGYKIIE